MKKGWVVTIGREFCSGGSEVAREVARRLQIPYYDRDLIDRAAERTNLSRETVAAHDERTKSFRRGDPYGGAYLYRDDPTLVLPTHARVFAAQCEVIRHMAGEGPCVIVGRCADDVLRECDKVLDVVSVFIRADLEKRVRRAMRIFSLEEGEARRLIQKTDRIRARYYAAHTQREWGAIGSYTLIVDTGEFGVEGAAALIEAAVKTLSQTDQAVL